MEDERTRAAKAEGAQGLSTIVSRVAGFPSTIGLTEISEGHVTRARSTTILDLPAASGPNRKLFTREPSGAAPMRPTDGSRSKFTSDKSITMRSGEANAAGFASTARDKSNTSLAAFSSCEKRTPTATGELASPAEPPWSGGAISVKTTKAASRPLRAILLPLGATPPRYRANKVRAQSFGLRSGP